MFALAETVYKIANPINHFLFHLCILRENTCKKCYASEVENTISQ